MVLFFIIIVLLSNIIKARYCNVHRRRSDILDDTKEISSIDFWESNIYHTFVIHGDGLW